MRIVFIAIICVSSFAVHSQTLKDLDQLDSITDSYRDTASVVTPYEEAHYKAMDSSLNQVYKALKASLTPGDFEKIKEAQRKWLKDRDAEFKKIENEKDCANVWPDVCNALTIRKKAYVVRKRVEELIALRDKLVK